jgi:hypothetical protein
MSRQANERHSVAVPGPEVSHLATVEALAPKTGARQASANQIQAPAILRRDGPARDQLFR